MGTARERVPWALYLAAGVFAAIIVAVVASSFGRSRPPGFLPSPVEPRPAGTGYVRDTVTIDARDPAAWTFFDFERSGVVPEPEAETWDLAFQRFHVIPNGGDGLPGGAAALALPAPFDSVREAPAAGYVVTTGRLDDAPAHTARERWYRDSVFAHTLEPKDETYVIRTSEGRYAKLRILSYYCPEATPGCVTIDYAYRGDGSRRLEP
ncbi:MAG: HmuY family protein [Gemmatimonadota bacterium]|nr:HmuY family protein [Gemmatimonadota bacterium]